MGRPPKGDLDPPKGKNCQNGTAPGGPAPGPAALGEGTGAQTSTVQELRAQIRAHEDRLADHDELIVEYDGLAAACECWLRSVGAAVLHPLDDGPPLLDTRRTAAVLGI